MMLIKSPELEDNIRTNVDWSTAGIAMDFSEVISTAG